jgi:hypothetical protein
VSHPRARIGDGTMDSDRATDTLVGLTLALAFVASYTIQRLVDATGEPPMGAILHQNTIPYYWRLAFAALHATGAAITVHLSVSAPTADRWLARAPWLILGIVAPAAVLLVLVP